MGAVDLLAQPGDLGVVGAAGALRPPAGSQHADRSDDRKGDDADDERQRRELVTMQLREGDDIAIELGKQPRLGSGGTRRRPGEDGDQGFRKQTCAPISPKASGLGPDRFRHPPAPGRPAIAPPGEDATGPRRCRGQAPPCCPRIAAMYLRYGKTLRG